jgi:hypothetical protein
MRRWHGGFPGEDAYYALHVEVAIRLLKEHGYERLSLSGGRTRPKLEKETQGVSEAEGMKAFALEMGLIAATDDRIILETLARDSMENVFLSMLAFHHNTQRWPARVGIVSWSSKGLRFHLIAAGMGLGGKIAFHGVGDYPTQADLERACAAEARFNAAIVDVDCAPPSYRLVDPLLRNAKEFATKRWARMPNKFRPDADGDREYNEEIKAAYGADSSTVVNLVDQVANLAPGDGWRHINWAWL